MLGRQQSKNVSQSRTHEGDFDNQESYSSSSDYDSDEEINSQNINENVSTLTNTQNRRVIEILQRNIMEPKNPCVLVTVKKTIREKIFPMLKFVNDDILRTVKLKEKNNMIHLLLQDLNRIDDSDSKRAMFWLAYRKEIKGVLTTRKTEVSNQMKDSVISGKMTIFSNKEVTIISDIKNF